MEKGAIEDRFAFIEFEKLIKKFNIKKIIETGTYYRWSTKKICEFGINVETIELDQNNFNQAQNLLKNINNVKLHLGSSPEILENILNEGEENIMFFLDAHWGKYWPLKDELSVIAKKKIKPIISIHDFYVPDGNGSSKFGYDSYNNQNLDFGYIQECLRLIYGDKYSYHYSDQIECVNSGLIYIYPN